MAKTNQELAYKEVKAWLDYKKVPSRTRESNLDSIELLEDMICEGHLTIDQTDFKITHKLLFPIGEEKELVYVPRLNDLMLDKPMKGVKSNDANGMLRAYVCALTDQNSGIIKAMDSQDKKVAMAIAVFFL